MTDSDLKKIRDQLTRALRERDRYRSELDRLQRRIQKMAIPPLLLATVSRLVDEAFVVIHTPSGNDFLVASPFESLKPGDTVGVDQQTLKIVKILPSNVDSFIAGMELDEKPEETYEDIGGLDDIIVTLREVVELPLTNPELFQVIGIEPPNGVLLEGPPGTGKTLIARAVANATHATFIRLVGSELIQKYIGEGARLVRELFSLAREKAPAVLFIDEIDAVASKRTQDSQVSDREVQRTLMQLLAEMDGFEINEQVKIIAATNRPDILDPAILRPGRFDRIIKVELPDAKGRLEIFKIHTRNMPLDEDIDLRKFAAKLEDLSGADIRSICQEAGMNAIRNNRRIVYREDFTRAFEIHIRKLREGRPAAAVYS
ncbi:MAG: proteasome-activating nucleotidase [Promethearchaeota archaeon]